MAKKIFLHILPWMVFTVYLMINNKDYYPDFSTGFYLFKQFISVLPIAIIFYINYFIFVPKLLISNRRIYLFSLALIGLFAIHMGLSLIFGKMLDLILGRPYFFDSILQGLHQNLILPGLIIALSVGVRLANQYYKDRYKKLQLQEHLRQAELEVLKAQINPHFLYNAFNSIYALAQAKSDETPEAVLQLSEIMRYTTYKAGVNQVSIHEELSFIKNYIDFQRLRTTDPDSKIITEIEPPETDFMICPLLLITFVENAFKHSNLVKPNHPIKIQFTSDLNTLFFKVTNEIRPNSTKGPGIGLANLKKILELLYPNKHKLEKRINNTLYTASLTINISDV